MHPTLHEALVRDRVFELRQGDPPGRARRERRRHHVTGALRLETGWLLIEWGLRLAVPPSAVPQRVARGQR